MIDITTWMQNFLQILNKTFANRIWFVGLQGSYGRGEATETSDIDVVVILDELSAMDIQTYNEMLDTMTHRELICGFLSGKNEILNWEPSDLFQFYYDTKPIKGSLDELLPLIDDTAVTRAIKIGVCNIYHGCVHNMLHEKSEDILRGLYKSASFVIQAIVFKQTGNYIKHQEELLQAISSNERGVVETFLSLKKGGTVDFIPMSEILFAWTKKWIAENNNQKNEQLLLEMAKELEKKNKTIWSSMWVIMTVSITALIAGLFITTFLIPDGVWQLVAILGICVVFLIPCFYALKLEISVGAYKCKNCGHEIVPTYTQALNAMHRGTTRYLKCPKCNKRTWCKKVLKK